MSYLFFPLITSLESCPSFRKPGILVLLALVANKWTSNQHRTTKLSLFVLKLSLVLSRQLKSENLTKLGKMVLNSIAIPSCLSLIKAKGIKKSTNDGGWYHVSQAEKSRFGTYGDRQLYRSSPEWHRGCERLLSPSHTRHFLVLPSLTRRPSLGPYVRIPVTEERTKPLHSNKYPGTYFARGGWISPASAPAEAQPDRPGILTTVYKSLAFVQPSLLREKRTLASMPRQTGARQLPRLTLTLTY